MATKWGVVSAGKICHDFVTAVRSIDGNEHEFVAVAARDINSAKQFASTHEIPKAYGSYEELAKDPEKWFTLEQSTFTIFLLVNLC